VWNSLHARQELCTTLSSFKHFLKCGDFNTHLLHSQFNSCIPISDALYYFVFTSCYFAGFMWEYIYIYICLYSIVQSTIFRSIHQSQSLRSMAASHQPLSYQSSTRTKCFKPAAPVGCPSRREVFIG